MPGTMSDQELSTALRRESNKQAVVAALRRIGRPATVLELSRESGVHPVAIGKILDRETMTLTSQSIAIGPRKKSTREFVTFHRHMMPHEIAAGFKDTP